jgi:hypothetical protein
MDDIRDLLQSMKLELDEDGPCTVEDFTAFIEKYEELTHVPLPFRALELFKFTRALMEAKGVTFIDAFLEIYHCPKGVEVGYQKGSATGIALSSFLEVAKNGITFPYLMRIVFDKQESPSYKAHIFFDMVEYCPRLATKEKVKCSVGDDEGYCNPPGVTAQSPELGAAFVQFCVLMIRLIGYNPVLLVAGGGAVKEALQLSEIVNEV